jgi:hypothetical protein
MLDLKSRWIGVNSLFYEGPLNILIYIRRLHDLGYVDNNPDGDFNIFSFEKTIELFIQQGYKFYFES